MSNNQSWHDSLCVEHKTKLDDSALKPVTACAYCGRDMCSFHLRPTLISIPNFNPKLKGGREIEVIIEASHKSGDGHPCKPYTDWFWKQYDEDEARSIRELEKSMNDMNRVESIIDFQPIQPPQQIPFAVKNCPKCDTSMRSSSSFCPICGEKQEEPTKQIEAPTTPSPEELPLPPPNRLKEFLKDLFGWR